MSKIEGGSRTASYSLGTKDMRVVEGKIVWFGHR